MEFKTRLLNIQNFLKSKKLDLLILEDQKSFLYLTGLTLSLGRLFITSSEVVLFVDGRYIEAAKKQIFFKSELLSNEKILDFINKNKIKKIGFDSIFFSYHSHEKLKTLLIKIPDIGLVPIENPLKNFRKIKDEEEIKKLKQSATINYQGFEHIKKLLKDGISEKEVAFEYEMFVKKNGAEKLSFDSIIAFGKNTSLPHYRASDAKLKNNEIVLIDIGCYYQNYASDMTRVVFFGNVDKKLQRLFEINKKAQKKALELCKPKVRLKDLDLAVREVFKKENVEDLFIHGLGHGVGLDVHEYPRIRFDNDDKDDLLEEGMVITIEPGLYVSGLGGVRYEDTIVITQDGYENFYPED